MSVFLLYEASEPPRMTPLAWVLMLSAFTAVTWLVIFCFLRILEKRGKPRCGMRDTGQNRQGFPTCGLFLPLGLERMEASMPRRRLPPPASSGVGPSPP